MNADRHQIFLFCFWGCNLDDSHERNTHKEKRKENEIAVVGHLARLEHSSYFTAKSLIPNSKSLILNAVFYSLEVGQRGEKDKKEQKN